MTQPCNCLACKVFDEDMAKARAGSELLEAGKRVVAVWLNAEPGGKMVQIGPQLADLRAVIKKAETLYPRG